jgi:hypothetical protein
MTGSAGMPQSQAPVYEHRETGIVFLALILGALARLVWVFTGGRIKPVINESHNVAVALAHSGHFADTFFPGQGPTAHVGMLTPLPSALVYRLFGADSVPAETLLALWSIALVLTGVWLCWRLACVLGAPPLARIAAVLFVCFVPLQFGLELREGRAWEVNLAVPLLLWVLLRLAQADGAAIIAKRGLAFTGAIAGFLFIASPPAGLAVVIAIALFSMLRLPLRRWWIAPASFILVAGLLAGFWAERNLRALGEPVPLRDNLGLELDLSNHSGAVDPADPLKAYVARLREIHPLFGAAERMRAVGEVAYYHDRGREAQTWIAAHPVDFLRLSVRHFVQFYLPPRWFWFTFGTEGRIVSLRQALAWITTLAGLATLLAMVWRKRAYAYLLAVTLACSLPYIFVQPILRYRYLVSTLLIFTALDGVGRLLRCLHTQRHLNEK